MCTQISFGRRENGGERGRREEEAKVEEVAGEDIDGEVLYTKSYQLVVP